MHINFKILTDCIGRVLGLYEEQRKKVCEKNTMKSYTFRKKRDDVQDNERGDKHWYWVKD